MLRFLVKFILFAIILAVATVYFAQWKLDSDITRFAQKLKPLIELDYESAKIDLSGEVTINSVRAYIASLGTTVEISQLSFFSGNLFQLTFLESDLEALELPENAYIILKDVLIPFNATLLAASKMTTQPSSLDILETAACGSINRFGLQQYESMGYSYLSFSSSLFYSLDKSSGSVELRGEVDVEDMFQLDYQVEIGSVLAWLESIQQRNLGSAIKQMVSPDISLMQTKVKDLGYNLRKAEYCAMREEIETRQYYIQHVAQLEQILNEVDIQLAQDFKTNYANAILPGSEYIWSLQPKANFEFAGVTYYEYSELMALSGLQLTVNSARVNEYVGGWSFEKFSRIAEIAESKVEQNRPLSSNYKTVFIKKSYQKIAPKEVTKYLDYPVIVTRQDGRQFKGKLSSVSAASIKVVIRNKEGEAILPIARSTISELQVLKRTPSK